ncbi:MAG: NAD-dependent epimerase/dehydratase family protein [Pseudomonadota bacterium]
MRRVLVTGANGFVGRHVVETLAARGDRVRALDLAFDPGIPPQVERVQATVTDAEAVTAAVEGCDGVIHAAAIADLWAEQRGAHLAVNLDGTQTVLGAARDSGARVVLVSSYTTLVAENTPLNAMLTEAELHEPDALLGPYPASKRWAEIAVEDAVEDGADALSVLPSAPVGPGDRRPTPPGRLILDLARGATPALIDTVLDVVDVRALALGIVAALDEGETGKRYLLSGQPLSLAGLARRVAEMTGVPAPRRRVPIRLALAAAQVEAGLSRLTRRPPRAPITGVRLAARRPRFDPGAARVDLGWHPPAIDDALLGALVWFHGEGMLDCPMPRYPND